MKEFQTAEKAYNRRPNRPFVRRKKSLTCGYRWCRPKWLRSLGNPRYFLLCFCCQNILQGASVSYFVGVKTSIVKQFNFSGQDIGYIVMMSEIGPILTSFLLSYLARNGNRPRWLGVGAGMACVGLLLSCGAAFIFPSSGPQEVAIDKINKQFCLPKEMEGIHSHNSSSLKTSVYDAVDENCDEPSHLLFFTWIASHSIIGIAGAILFTLGTPYLDENVKAEDSSVYFAILISARILGPLVGLSVAALMKNDVIAKGVSKNLGEDEWLKALSTLEWESDLWWMGPAIFATGNFFLIFIMSSFPRHMRKPRLKPKFHLETDDGEIFEIEVNPQVEKTFWNSSKKAIQEFNQVMQKLYSNRALVFSIASDFFAYLGVFGFFLWLPTYLEQQFRIEKGESALYTGIATSSSIIIGVLGGGLFIRQCRPSARILVYVMLICKASFILSLIGMMFITCDFNHDHPGKLASNSFSPGELKIESDCSRDCKCADADFMPICVMGEFESQSYFSPCHAGCSLPGNDASSIISSGKDFLPSCSCIQSRFGSISVGHCEATCSNFTLYNMISVVVSSFISIGAIGGLMITIRCVSSEEKSMALGLKATAIALSVFLTPVIYEWLAGSSCLLWKERCSKKYSCWIFDSDDFRYKLHGVTASIFFLSFICETFLLFNVKGIKIVAENNRSTVAKAILSSPSRGTTSTSASIPSKMAFLSSFKKPLRKSVSEAQVSRPRRSTEENMQSCEASFGELVIKI